MHSSELRRVSFPAGTRTGLFRVEGFAAPDVDDFLQECEVALGAHEEGRVARLTSEDVVTKGFRTFVRKAGCYDMDAVSEFLDRVADALRQHEQRVP
ncbi:DivIVA domain-containing protein [Microbacterium sp. zg-Y818]|uniref:DivIVA domain-containing protein n=1 Tax=unclassified Microbacterium TaxID=2609290 RepID=UPI00214B5397|nr:MULTISPECIES: DivIVA domain-containing protein [unclassified Microbacterium]MCR2799512.1 DivIVA domain-containing protein [Microbacterium sp. zg.Y818]WIM21507.1 DivIVA domain-containing protein [Microbacterium sp. zg-Y818]